MWRDAAVLVIGVREYIRIIWNLLSVLMRCVTIFKKVVVDTETDAGVSISQSKMRARTNTSTKRTKTGRKRTNTRTKIK